MAGVNDLKLLALHLGPDQPIYGLVPLNWGDPQAQYNRIEQMAHHYLQSIRILQPEGPYFLGGYSFGGLVAFEMAHQLRAEGQKVQLLALIDTHPSEINRSLKYYLSGISYYLKCSKPDILIDFLALKVKKVFTSRSSSYDPLWDQIMTRIRTAMKTYTLRAYPNQIIFFEATESPVPWPKSKDYLSFRDDRSDWAKVATGGLEIYPIPGDHLTIFDEPCVQILAEKLRACLDRAQIDERRLRK
jgi:thioesterase domain-containing protein